MSLVISNYPLRPLEKKLPSTFFRKRKLFNSGQIILNGESVTIGGSMEFTADRINEASYITGVKAVSQISMGRAKLILSTNAAEISIIDPQKLLLNLYKSNKISSENDSLIQIINNKSREMAVKINYFTKVSSIVDFHSLKEEFLKVGKSQYKSNSTVSGSNSKSNGFHNSNIVDNIQQGALLASSETPQEVASEAYGFARKTTTSSYKIIRFNV